MRLIFWKFLVFLALVYSAVVAEDNEEDDEEFDYFQMIDDAHLMASERPNLLDFSQGAGQLQALEKLASTGFFLQVQNGDKVEKDVEGHEMPQDTQEAEAQDMLQARPKLSKNCTKSHTAFVEARDSLAMWALMMVDAGGKPESGLLLGETHWLGSYSECLNVSSEGADPPFKAKYCTLTLRSALLPTSVRVGTCQPDPCTSNDIKKIVQANLKDANITGVTVKASCPVFETEFDEPATAVLATVGVFALLLVLGTAYDVLAVQWPKWRQEEQQGQREAITPTTETRLDEKKIFMDDTTPLLGAARPEKPEPPGVLGQLLLSFSLYTNSSKLFSTAQGEGALTAVNGIRFLSMTWVVLGHTLSSGMKAFRNKASFSAMARDRWTMMAIVNATVSVDSFFFLSGLLVAYLTFKEFYKVKSLKKFNWVMFYVHRFWRLTPPYMFVMMVFVPLSKYMSEGPLWSTRGMGGNCNEKWWTNVLYINNLVEKVSCMGWAWYLANDMQFYVLSPLIMVPFYFHAGLGSLVAGVFLLGVTITPGVLSYDRDWGPSNLGGGNGRDYFSDYYVKPWNRMGPYIIGLVMGYVLQRTKCKVRMPKLVVLLGWCAAAAMALAVLYGPVEVVRGHFMTRELAAFYNATNRTAWSIALAWVVFACATGHGGIVNMLMSWSALVPLSRLTYCCYLVHPIIQYLYYSSIQVYLQLSDINIIYMFFGHLMATYLVAYVTSMTFEAPMMGLERALLRRDKK